MEQLTGKSWFLKGMKDGIPIAMGYLAVSFTLGIAAKKVGMTPFQAALMSGTMHASAGQFAAIGMIASGSSYLEMAATELIVNLRYMLMSSSLSQKVQRNQPFFHRFLLAYDVTDEIFGISMAVKGKLHPAYTYGAMSVASPGWVLGTYLGAVFGMIMPTNVLSAMNVALYGMFLAIVIPASKQNRVIAGVVICSMFASALFTWIPGINQISSGFQMIILTMGVAGIAAVLFPVNQEENNHEG